MEGESYYIFVFHLTYCSYLEVLDNNPDIDRNETLGHFIQSRGYSELFQKAYLVRTNAWSFIFYVYRL